MTPEADLTGLLIEVVRAAPNVGGLLILAVVLIRLVDRFAQVQERLIERCYDLPESMKALQISLAANTRQLEQQDRSTKEA